MLFEGGGGGDQEQVVRIRPGRLSLRVQNRSLTWREFEFRMRAAVSSFLIGALRVVCSFYGKKVEWLIITRRGFHVFFSLLAVFV